MVSNQNISLNLFFNIYICIFAVIENTAFLVNYNISLVPSIFYTK